MLAMIATGRLTLLAVITGLAFLTTLSWFQPIPLVLIVLAFSTNVLQFVSLEYLPYFQVAAGIRLNAQDITLLLLVIIGGLHLLRRNERPRFLQPLIFFAGAILLATVFGWAADTTSPDAALNGLRAYSGYLLYVGLVGVIDTQRKAKALAALVFLILVVSVGIQVLEAIQGARIITPFSPASEYFGATKNIIVGGVSIPYLWNRATGYLFLGLFLALGAALTGKANTKHMVLGVWAVIGVIIALVRQWLVIILVGMLLLVILAREKKLQSTVKIVGVGVLILLSIILISGQIPSFSLLDVVMARLSTLISFQAEPNFIVRRIAIQQLLAVFWRSPLLGYGPGSGLLNSDVGVYNTLVELGIIGTTAVAYLIGFVFIQTYRKWKVQPDSLFKAYLTGLLAAWTAIIVGYGFGIDFFGQMSMTVGLTMALIDRMSTLIPSDANAGNRLESALRQSFT